MEMAAKRVVCAGASIVRGEFSASFVRLLRQRMEKDGFEFINEGVNGDLAYNLLNRLDSITAHQPDFVVILVGTNDVTGLFSPKVGESMRKIKNLPQAPSKEWYQSNMRAIVRRLKETTSAKIGLCSLPNIGEDLNSDANILIRSYNDILAGIARQEEVGYIAVNEAQSDYLRKSQTAHGRAVEARKLTRITFKFLMLRNVLRLSLDRIARINGYLLTAEGIHMNSKGAAMIADQIEAYLRDER
ncbi:MAG: GDSL-type esterase/lipase family protein [Anaerolineae bacterium]